MLARLQVDLAVGYCREFVKTESADDALHKLIFVQ